MAVGDFQEITWDRKAWPVPFACALQRNKKICAVVDQNVWIAESSDAKPQGVCILLNVYMCRTVSLQCSKVKDPQQSCT